MSDSENEGEDRKKRSDTEGKTINCQSICETGAVTVRREFLADRIRKMWDFQSIFLRRAPRVQSRKKLLSDDFIVETGRRDFYNRLYRHNS